jgi:hypothetical protein
MSREEYEKLSEQTVTQQPIHQQKTVIQQSTPPLRAHRRDKRVSEVTTQIQKPPVKEKVTEDLKRPSWFKQNGKYLGFGMLVMTILYIVMVAYIYPAYVYTTTRWDYGQAKITHFDLNVGHNGTSHFIAEYWNNQAVVIEFPQNHPEQAKSYALRMSSDGAYQPRIVTLHLAYINAHGKPGYPDLAVQVEGFALPGVLYNTGDGFSTEQPS